MWSCQYSKIKAIITKSKANTLFSQDLSEVEGSGAFAGYFLKQNRSWQNVLELLVAAGVIALLLVLAEAQAWSAIRPSRLFEVAFFVGWIILSFVTMMQHLQPMLRRYSGLVRMLLAFLLLQLDVVLTTALLHMIHVAVDSDQLMRDELVALKAGLLLNLSYGVLIGAICLRYIYVREQWLEQQRSELLARIQAMQARIHPHFLFNSLNSVVSLIGSDPVKAENMLIDLSRLFRASFKPLKLVSLSEEIQLCKHYLAIEETRLGSRLQVDWRIQANLDQLEQAQIPLLTLQPLLENSIFHGAEQIAGEARVSILVEILQNQVSIVITNPCGQDKIRPIEGHGIAIDNVKQRLTAYFGHSLKFQTYSGRGLYTTVVRYQSPRLMSTLT